MELVTRDQLADRWECQPDGVDFAVRSGFIPSGVEILDDEVWEMNDVLMHEIRSGLPIPEAIRAIADARRNDLTGPDVDLFKAQTLTQIILTFAGTPHFREMVEIFREATGETNV